MAYKINGRRLSDRINRKTKSVIESEGLEPGLAVIVAANGKGNVLYARIKARKARELGIDCHTYKIRDDVSERDLISLVDELDMSPLIDGIIVQMPLPKRFNPQTVVDHIDVHKDVDGMTIANLGKLADDRSDFYTVSNTAKGVMDLLSDYGRHDKWYQSLSGKRALIIGRSRIVGRPLAFMMINAGAEVTVINHYADADKVIMPSTAVSMEMPGVKFVRSPYDIIVSAAGHPQTVNLAESHQVVIDVGEDKDQHGHLCGDVSRVAERRSRAYSPVPGGCGPMTVAELMRQVVECDIELTRLG